ncbi:MAG: hypothetical protein GTO12_18730 [Proteobacteria bacterium]|nr:hypothetical protein [Pseudomonadota bacterium]
MVENPKLRYPDHLPRPLRLLIPFPLLVLSFCSLAPIAVWDYPSPTKSSARFENIGKISDRSIPEPSGLVKSRRWPDLFWTHNDSGGDARIFAIRQDGSGIDPSRSNSGIEVAGAQNVDWEDIAIDDEGYLIIGDIGNNVTDREILALYRVQEPDPFRNRRTGSAERISVYFPDSPNRAFDCEALFSAEGEIYLLTKTRGGKNTGLYRVDRTRPEEKSPLLRIGSFDFGSPVTGADSSPDGRFLAVLTYAAVWVFERPTGSANYLAGRKSSFPFRIWQCEAVSFDRDRLLIVNEGGRLFELKVNIPQSLQ